MDDLLKSKIDLMIDNFHILKTDFKWESNLPKHFGAMIYATSGKRVDPELIKTVKQYIKDETGWMSAFRGLNIFPLSCLLSLQGDYKTCFKDMQRVFEQLRVLGFKNSTYLPLAAFTIVKEVPEHAWAEKLHRMNSFYENMKKNHFWLTSADDYVFAAVLGATNLNVDETSSRIEECYQILNASGFYKGNDLQTLSHILALGEEPVKDKCNKAVNLYHKLAENKCKLNYHGLASLGVLTLITPEGSNTVSELIEVNNYLYDNDGYGFWGIDKLFRSILSANLISDYYVDSINDGILQITMCNSISAIMIAQQQATIAAVCACSAAAASAGSAG